MEKIMEVVRIKQIVTESDQDRVIVRSPYDASRVAIEFIGDDDREVLLVMCLNTKNEIVAVHRCSVGVLDATYVHPREIYKTCLMNNCSGLILAHQHPSQNVTPSRDDIEVTSRVQKAGEILGIPLLDHLIVSSNRNFTSLKEKGYL